MATVVVRKPTSEEEKLADRAAFRVAVTTALAEGDEDVNGGDIAGCYSVESISVAFDGECTGMEPVGV